MKSASDLRLIARNALSGRWGIAVLAGFIASLLGGTITGGGSVNIDLPTEKLSTSPEYYRILEWLLPLLMILAGIMLVVALVMLLIGSFVQIGYARFNLELLRHRDKPDVGLLFHYARYFGTALAATFLRLLYILLWTLLYIPGVVAAALLDISPLLFIWLLIPAIRASFSYAMTPYILAENPDLPASEAIIRSKNMMQGNRFRLFCLEFSFIGWSLLCVLSLGIGMLWLRPYVEAAHAAFYREISGVRTPAAE